MKPTEMSKCIECGALCCKAQCAIVNIGDSLQEEYWKARGYIDRYKTDNNQYVYMIASKCKSLNHHNQCLVQEDKPQLCKNFPEPSDPYARFFCKLVNK